ncbi:hypothetical protein ACQCSX_18890 [Pseudarthrobacter sp. P1]|uniref:hypothetical protein n=1 Tax=Pseudarthrobacter sp. P1 TaxID=3418418 RepID=UPI003CF44AD7
MLRSIRSGTFILDQATSSIISFLLMTTLAKTGGTHLVGTVAVLQSILLIALTVARSLSLDVWASRGARSEERKSATATALLFPILSAAVLGPVIWLMGAEQTTVMLYWLAVPAVLVLDTVRVLLLHADKSWLSLVCQLVTLSGLVIAAIVANDPAVSMGIYTTGVIFSCIVGFTGLRMMPPLPSPKYAVQHKQRSLPFLAEVSMGSIVQQILLLLLAGLSSIQTVGEIRLAQTMLGPMSIIHAGISPQILRRLGQKQDSTVSEITRSGIKSGWILASISFFGVIALVIVLNIKVSASTILVHIVGAAGSGISPVIIACGLALAFNGVVLGTGVAARVVGLTTRLNKTRVFVIPIQIAIICFAALSNVPFVAAAGFALTAIITALISIWVLRTDSKAPSQVVRLTP